MLEVMLTAMLDCSSFGGIVVFGKAPRTSLAAAQQVFRHGRLDGIILKVLWCGQAGGCSHGASLVRR